MSLGLSLSSNGALVAIRPPGQVADTLSHFAEARRQIKHLDMPIAA